MSRVSVSLSFFERYLEDDGYISVEEYRTEEYARDRFVDLVPNQNGFGHMTKWLEKEEFKDLAEMPRDIPLGGCESQAR